MDPEHSRWKNRKQLIPVLAIGLVVFAGFISASDPLIRILGCGGIVVAVLVYLFGSDDDSSIAL